MLSDPASLWHTVAHDLARFDPSLAKNLVEVVIETKVDPGMPDIALHFPFLPFFISLHSLDFGLLCFVFLWCELHFGPVYVSLGGSGSLLCMAGMSPIFYSFQLHVYIIYTL
jgi:hypothetical protein